MLKEVAAGNRRISVPLTLTDRFVNWLDPVRGVQRIRARAFQALVGSYHGASKTRRGVKEWTTVSSDPDSDILYDLPTLRDRSRDLIRNAPIATGALNTSLVNVVGTGLKLQARVDGDFLGMSDEQADEWEDDAERKFRLWAESQECDISRTLNFYGLQNLAYRQTFENGDVFALLPRFARTGSPFLLKINLVEADRVCNKNNMADSETLVAGVQKDIKTGAPVAYHVVNQHPGMVFVLKKDAFTWAEVPAFGAKTGMRNVLHLYDVLRPGQTRGVPHLAPIMEQLRQISSLTDNELMASTVASLFTVFIKSKDGGIDFDISSTGMAAETGATASDTDIKMGNGNIVGLSENEDISTAAPGRPNAAFEPFFLAIVTQIGAALGIPAEIIMRSFNSSFSASRAALLEAWRFFRSRRVWLVGAFCQPIYETWLYEAVASGMVSAPGFFANEMIRKAYSGAVWCGDSPGYIDPAKEVQPARDRIEAMLSTYDEETTLLTGGDFEKNVRQRAKEQRKLIKAGLIQKQEPAATLDGGDENANP
jgi:lambda family phage portal protein